MSRRDQILYRDVEEQKLWGVSSGLGRYFDIDTDLVRIAFIALTLVGGGGLIAYILLALLLDPAPPGYYKSLEMPGTEIDLDRPVGQPSPPVGRQPESISPEIPVPQTSSPGPPTTAGPQETNRESAG